MESAVNLRNVWVADDSIVSPLGADSEENFSNVVKSVSGLSRIADPSLSANSVYAGQIPNITGDHYLTRFEKMCTSAVSQLTSRHMLPAEKTLFVLSTTKGNIDLLKSDPSHPRIHLHATARHIAKACGFKHSLVVSNACISGVMAIAVAKRYLERGEFDHAIVVGADELTSFVVSGFESLGALSNEQCRPFDQDRAGINLGEAAGVVLLTTQPERFAPDSNIKVLGFGLTNDANHISGPSRTGEELALAIRAAINESRVSNNDIDFISAHGTATLYNDEMESKAFALSGFSETSLNSLKGFYGHTLGAAGVVEMIISIHSLKRDTLVPSIGYRESGVSQKLNVIEATTKKPLKTFLKTASGFGGCNAAMIIQKQSI